MKSPSSCSTSSAPITLLLANLSITLASQIRFFFNNSLHYNHSNVCHIAASICKSLSLSPHIYDLIFIAKCFFEAQTYMSERDSYMCERAASERKNDFLPFLSLYINLLFSWKIIFFFVSHRCRGKIYR